MKSTTAGALHQSIGRTGLMAALIIAVVLACMWLAPPARAASGAWTTETIAGMSVRVYTPATPPALVGGRALMISLHGCQQKAQDLQDDGNWTDVADEYGMVVALPDAPNGGVYLGCWDYYDSDHNSTNPSRHDDNVLALAQTLQSRGSLAIDPDQTYVSGLSSGGAESMVVGCLFPQVFAGVGINAGPTIGTSTSGYSWVSTSKTTATDTCKRFAGDNSTAFQTQLTSVVYGSNDATVAAGYNTLNAQIMAGIYGAGTSSTFSLSGLAGTNTTGSGTLYSDASGPRVSVIQNTGLGHNWPAGTGTSGTYISGNSIDYPAYVTKFFFENNRRVGGPSTPGPTPVPTPTPTPTPTDQSCVAASNATHQAAGRALSYGIAPYKTYYAKGSYAYMGQGDATVTTLRQQSSGSWTVVVNCS
ncbi:alpha/beta hydrolase family esterase [Microbacterium sp. ZW T2_14]|uniref:extracellular catalytic domain type 1 short-chain-length polyhydroxyalkanoate depolymerase n=1 Tax=Microbacterium sp. ZW T2_14 TaxID=3378079 RepID=UPI0038531F3B